MSFLLKSSRLATGFIGFSRQARLTFRRRRFFLRQCQRPLRINETFFRSYAAVPETSYSQTTANSIPETLFQKSVSQVYFDIRYKGYAIKEDLYDAWHTLKSSTPFTTEQTVLLIKCCGHSLPLEQTSDKIKLVKEIWDSYDDIGIEKTIAHYNALLDVYVELEHELCPNDFLRNLETKGVTPNVETYKKLIQVLSIQGKISSAQEILEHMKMRSIGIDNGVFNSLILGYSLQGDFISARGILELMKEKHLTLTPESYVNLALGYAKQGEIEKVLEILDESKHERKFLSPIDFLELAYTFAVNNHSEHFSLVLDKILLRKNFPTISTKVVHRLLHKRMDKEALSLLEFRDRLESVNKVKEPIQMFLDHYVRFREPDEVLNIAELYHEKGWSSIAFAYGLKETLIRKDVPHCLRFFNAMKARKYPVRVHYFYPVLLKSSKSGNKAVLEMIMEMHKYNVTLGREVMKAFHRFYNFRPGAEFEDLEKLVKAGINKGLVAWKILNILLNRRDIDNAVKLVSNWRILYPSILVPTALSDAFREGPNDPERFVYILYHLIHNLKLNKKGRTKDFEVHSFEYEQFIFEIAKHCSKPFSMGVMEEMLRKRIPLSPDAAMSMSKFFTNPKAADLLSKLSSPNLKFEFDETLLKRLSEEEDFGKKKEYFKKLGRKGKWLQLQNALQRQESISSVVKIFEDLAQKPEPLENEKYQKTLKKLLEYVSVKGDAVTTERIYGLGVEKNLIREDYYAPCFIAHLVSGNMKEALRRFHEGLKASGKCMSLGTLIQEIKQKDTSLALEDLRVAIADVCGQSFASTKLLIEFSKLGLVPETKKILHSKVPILKQFFKKMCRERFKEGHVTFFDTLKKAASNTNKISKNCFYYPLVRLYTLNGDLENLLVLYVELERNDHLTDAYRNIFLDSLTKFGDEVPEKLQQVYQCIKEDCQRSESKEGIVESVLSDEDIQNYLSKDVQPVKIKSRSSLNLDYKENILQCFCLIHEGKVDEYFNLLRKKINEDGPEKAKEYFFCDKLLPQMTSNQERLEEYKELVTMCGFSNLWKNYLKMCLRLGNIRKIKTSFQNLSPSQVRSVVEEISFEDCVRIVESAECHRQLGKEISIFYFKVINQCMNENNLEMATKYYERAKKHKLDEILMNFAGKEFLKV